MPQAPALPRGFELLTAPDTSVASVHVARAAMEEVQETVDAESAAASQAEESPEAQTGSGRAAA